MKGAISSGHPLTTEAACRILKKGGNAFDAVIAAAFASVVTEPTLNSLGGGGFLLSHREETGEDILYDFFVDTPGRGQVTSAKPILIPVELQFKSTRQVFHIGMGSIATPGTLKGLIHGYRSLCSMDITDIVEPALTYLNGGVKVSEVQAYLMNILKPILSYSYYGREIYKTIDQGRLYNPLLKEFLSHRSPGKWLHIFHSHAQDMEEKMKKEGGVLTAEDILKYHVFEREPLTSSYRGYELVTNPPPAFGGTLLREALSYIEAKEIADLPHDERELMEVSAMEQMRRLRNGPGGTTHISIVDEDGNAASMTVSNGSNSGYFFADTGIMLNNMMGEDDLHPGGFYSSPPGQRVRSMMCPTFIKNRGKIHSVIGSGGSKRIRTALLQVIINLIDLRKDVKSAVEAPRFHLDDSDILQTEPGFSGETLTCLRRQYKINVWKEKDMYFGGVHTVMGDLTGWGDSRRGGCFQRVE
jgi:gamma-glutamyltranspeptidase/glutathione hydrolase